MSFLKKLFGLEKKPVETDNTALLLTVYGNEEIVSVEALLGSTDIPFFCRERGAGELLNVLAGNNIYGTDIFVPADRLEEAKELLSAVPAEDDEPTDAGESETK